MQKKNRTSFRSSSRALALEPRLLFDGAGAVAAVDHFDMAGDHQAEAQKQEIRPAADAQPSEVAEKPAAGLPLLDLDGDAANAASDYQLLLGDAASLAQQKLVEWVGSDAFRTQAAEIFSADAGSAEWNAQLDSLRSEIINASYGIRTEVRSNAEMQGLLGAFSASNGEPTLYLNAAYLANASAEQVSQVLIEEIGHAIDHQLNRGQDSLGDEGHAFAALVIGGNADLAANQIRDDHHVLTLDGQSLAVESAAPYNIAQTHFVPMPEDQIWSGIQNVYSGGSDNKIESIIAITATSKDTHVVYDHWEDGYENDIKNPVGTSSTRIWWYNASGQWVDVKTGATLTDGHTVGNVTAMGQTLILRNQVNKNSMATVDFDGGDKIGSTKAISVTRAGWDTKIGTIVGGAVNLIDVGNAGTSYVIPVGTNTTEAPKISGTSILQKDSLFIMAYENNTVVTVNLVKADGTPNGSITRTLQQGQSWYIGGLASGATVAGTGLADAKAVINEGTKVTADKKIGVNMLSGSNTSQNRWYGIAPTESWGNSYYAPVATVGSATSHIYLFNNNTTDITVKYETLGAGGVVEVKSVTVAAGKSKVVAMPTSAGHFYSADGKAFYAVATVDPTTSRDWSYSLVAERTLTDRFVVAWGPGNGDANPAGKKNGSPVWVTAVDDTYLYIDSATTELRDAANNVIAKDVAKSAAAGPNVSAYKVDRLQSYRLRDTSDNNQTGLVVYTVDGTLITAAWGEDATVADTGSPYLDMGTTISPYPDYVLEKKAAEIVNKGRVSGVIEAGDEVKYTITLTNRAVIQLFNMNIQDSITPAGSADYVANSLELTSYDESGNKVWVINAAAGTKTWYLADGTIDASKGTNGIETDISLSGDNFDAILGATGNGGSGGYLVTDNLNRDPAKTGLQIGGFIQFTYRVTIKTDISKELADANFVVSNSVKLTAPGVDKDKVNNIDLSGTITDGVVTFISGSGGNEVTSFEPGNEIWIRVTDNDQNKDKDAAEGTLKVILTNATTGEKETVTLAETGVNTGIFEGKVSTTRGTGSATDNATDGSIKLKRGDEIRVEYTDPNTGGDGSGDLTTGGVDNPTNWGINSPNYQAGENNNVKTALVDDSGISVNDILVNEASPYGVFTVQGAQGQLVKLALDETGTDAGHAVSGTDYGNSLEYFDVTENAWKPYTTDATVEIKNTDGTLLVRNPIINDPVFEGPETYQLIVTPMKADGTTPGSATTGTATIFDDGTGTIWKEPTDPSTDPTGKDDSAPKDHDRFPQVDNPVVNEGSGHVVFTVTTQPNDTVTKLTFKDGTAKGSTVDGSTPKDGTVDYENNHLQYSTDGGATWSAIKDLAGDATNGWTLTEDITVTTGTLLVRTQIVNDHPYEYSETFTLAVDTVTAGHAVGTATIKDDGTGDVFHPTTGAKDPSADKNDDRAPITINNPTANEASGYVVFDIQGKKDQVIDLALADGTATGAGLTGADPGDNAKDYENRLDQLQYWNGSSWANYVPANGITITDTNGALKVRVKIHNDTPFEGAETFKLTASDKNIPATTATGIATIFDDGTGDIYDNTTGDKDTTTPKNDDRIPVPPTVITIDNPVVNEGSGYVIFTITTQNTTDKITKLTLADGTATSTGSNEGDVDYVIGTFEYWDGSAWQTYTNDTDLSSGTPIAVQTNGSNGELKVRVKINQDSLYEQSETFTLKVEGKDVSNNDLTAATGTATIKDDGTGSIWEFTDPGNSPPVPNDPSNPGSTPFDDDRILVKVDNPVVNEASGYVVFTVNNTNTTNPMDVKLSLTDGTAKGSANVAPASGERDKDFRNNSFQYWNGSAWVEYTPGSSSDVTIAANGELKVRVQIYNDTVYEGAETFDLNVTPSSGTAVKGTATILDDGTGSIWEFTDPLSPNEPTPTPKDPSNPGTTPFNDDRKPYVSSPTVNEGSEYVVFEVTTVKNEVLSDLKFADNTAKVGTVNGSEPKDGSVDYGSTLEYSTDGGSSWSTYTSGGEVTVPTGTLLVRTKVANDDSYEVSENFNLTVTVKSDGKTATGVATILDDGTGTVWVDDPGPDGKLIEKPYDPLSPDGIDRDDDRPVSVNSPTVNEGSGYIVFEVGGITGTKLQSLTLGDGTAKGGSATNGTEGAIDFNNTTPLQYYNGSAWVDFVPGTTAIPPGGTLLVRVAIFNDTAYENAETFTLTAKTTGGKEATGTGTIKDDGTGDVFKDTDGTKDLGATKDDDRTISITNGGKFEGGTFTAGSVREDVQYTYFKVTDVAEGIQVKLAVTNDTTNLVANPPMQFSIDGGTTWQNYSDANKPVAPNDGVILVRVDISSENTDPIEPDETFRLVASFANNPAKSTAASGMGIGTITDKLANAPKITPDDMNNGAEYPDAKEKGGEITVYEHGLKDSSGKQTATGTLKVEAKEGIKEIILGDDSFTLDQLRNGQGTITTTLGTLKVTEVTVTEGPDNKPTKVTLTYTYSLHTPDDHTVASGKDDIASTEEITIGVKDDKENTAENKITISIIDDKPLARNDEASLIQVTPSVGGSVMGNDYHGGDTSQVTGIQAGSGTADVSGNVNTRIKTEYGWITVQPDGSYVYELDRADPRVATLTDGFKLQDHVTYTITDEDGDTSTAVLTITINPEAPGAVVAPPPTDSVPPSPLDGPAGSQTPISILNGPVITDPSVYFANERHDNVQRMPLPFHPIVYVNREVASSQAQRDQDDPRGFSDPSAAVPGERPPVSLGAGLGQDPNLFVSHAIRDSQSVASFLRSTVEGRYSRLGLGSDGYLASPGLFSQPATEISELLKEQRKKLKKAAGETSAAVAEHGQGDAPATQPQIARAAGQPDRAAARASGGVAAPSFNEQLRSGAARLPMAARKV